MHCSEAALQDGEEPLYPHPHGQAEREREPPQAGELGMSCAHAENPATSTRHTGISSKPLVPHLSTCMVY